MFSVTSLKKDAANDIEFILIASQTAFDLVGQENINNRVWSIIKESKNSNIFSSESDQVSLHQVCGKVAEEIMKDAIREKLNGNISVIMIAFKKLEEFYYKKDICLSPVISSNYS